MKYLFIAITLALLVLSACSSSTGPDDVVPGDTTVKTDGSSGMDDTNSGIANSDTAGNTADADMPNGDTPGGNQDSVDVVDSGASEDIDDVDAALDDLNFDDW